MSATNRVATRYGDKLLRCRRSLPCALNIFIHYKKNSFHFIAVQVHHRLGATALPMMLEIEPAMMHSPSAHTPSAA